MNDLVRDLPRKPLSLSLVFAYEGLLRTTLPPAASSQIAEFRQMPSTMRVKIIHGLLNPSQPRSRSVSVVTKCAGPAGLAEGFPYCPRPDWTLAPTKGCCSGSGRGAGGGRFRTGTPHRIIETPQLFCVLTSHERLSPPCFPPLFLSLNRPQEVNGPPNSWLVFSARLPGACLSRLCLRTEYPQCPLENDWQAPVDVATISQYRIRYEQQPMVLMPTYTVI
ncbi:uncharacterized protein CLUP02_00823 [Colletotrichum lupini]|uniref:Uncharacterized protein n=1 Tax=Colletotrichum lupini TaxID=145971 RepID=A0A9Q8SBJ4_9PEZI|nr:uncharacterized protein CLUP02_00823 [Colletotrichum lupini]UQC74175.1 hypothetical protein CLUP02_00823 [Colletotrichum lupini]